MSINKQQQRAIDRVLGYYERHVIGAEKSVYSMEHQIENGAWHISLVVRVTRTDCEPASPRAIFCNDGGHFMIGKRGRIQVCSSYALKDPARREADLLHIAFMIGGVVSFKGRRVTYEQCKAATDRAHAALRAKEAKS
jgi:hypothetical protein